MLIPAKFMVTRSKKTSKAYIKSLIKKIRRMITKPDPKESMRGKVAQANPHLHKLIKKVVMERAM